MAQPSKAGAVFLFIFGLPFFGFGLFAAVTFLAGHSVQGNANAIAAALFASVFAIIGAGLMFGAVWGYRKQKRDEETRDANASSPWLWRDDWAQSRALSKHRSTIYGWWIGTALASMIFAPIAVTNALPMLGRGDPKGLLLLALCLIPAALLTGAVRATLRRRRYGQTSFQFATLPFSPGQQLSGQIQLRLDGPLEHGIDLRLSCIRRIVTGSGKEQSTNEVVLWQDDRNVPQQAVIMSPLGTSIPVGFQIPENAYCTNHDVPRDQLLWVLHAQADVPGVDYIDDFEVPVFRSTAKAAWAGAGVTGVEGSTGFRTGFSSSVAPDLPASPVPEPADPRVEVSTTTQGETEFYFPAFRNPTQTLMLLVFTIVWTAVVYLLLHSKAPWPFAAVFGFFDLLLFYGCAQSLFGTARIVVGDGRLTWQKGYFGGGSTRELPYSDIESIQAAASAQNSKAYFSIRLKTKNGKAVTLADSIVNRGEARWVVQEIDKLIGLKADTQVVLQTFGSDLGPPPQ